MPPVNTAKVNRRPLVFASTQDILRDAESLVAAERDGRLERLGNWTLGQALGHVATWIDYGFDGYPMKTPWFLKILGPLLKRSVLSGSLRAGMRIPGVAEGTYATEMLPTDEGLRRLRDAFARLDAAAPAKPNPVFGRLTHEEWKKLHRSHAALHMSFFRAR